MSVIVDEMTATVDPPAGTQAPQTASASSGTAPLDPQRLQEELMRMDERRQRLVAD